ncbi:MAG: uroporphyrinogen-III synthase [Verrucomicrobia bacterium]|nr:uroporphyrinogen-III synthase [Verrucomicrobiota bacterium]
MKTVLHVGLEPPQREDVKIIHCPLIETVPRVLESLSGIDEATCVIATSKTAVRCLFQEYREAEELKKKLFLSVGRATTECLKSFGVQDITTAQDESQEGVVELIRDMKGAHRSFFWGHSALSRQFLSNFIREEGYALVECVLYDTVYRRPETFVCLDEVDEIFFSSPSTVAAFCSFFGELPKDKKLHAQGRQTALAIQAAVAQTT